MRHGIVVQTTWVVTLLFASSALALLAADPPTSDHEAMQGEWTIESLTFHGNVVEPSELSTWRRVVEKNHAVWKRGEEVLVELDIKFDAALKPKTLDSTVASGPNKGQTALAIYELDGDTLRVCFADPGQARPTEFSSNTGSLQGLYTAKRVKKP